MSKNQDSTEELTAIRAEIESSRRLADSQSLYIHALKNQLRETKYRLMISKEYLAQVSRLSDL